MNEVKFAENFNSLFIFSVFYSSVFTRHGNFDRILRCSVQTDGFLTDHS